MANVCQKCGDKGYPELLIYCIECQIYSQHRYCFNEISSPDEKVSWLCELCLSRLHEMNIRRLEYMDNAQKSTVLTGDCCMLEEEDNGLDSDVQKWDVDRKIIKPRRRLILADDDSSDEESESVKIAQNFTDRDSLSGSPIQTTECLALALVQDARDHIVPMSCTSSPYPVSEGQQGASLVQVPHICNSTDCHSYVYSQPIIDPIWRGCFSTCNDDTYGIISAHLSNKACPNVCKGASMLSVLLSVEKLARTLVWPKAFQVSPPTDDNIALYFFAGCPRDDMVFGQLVRDINSQDLALRATIDGAELLIFSSLLLPQQYHKFQGKCYLWGVFRSSKTPLPHRTSDHCTSANSHTSEHAEKLNEFRQQDCGEEARDIEFTNSNLEEQHMYSYSRAYKENRGLTNSCLELFPLAGEDMAITARVRETDVLDLELGLGFSLQERDRPCRCKSEKSLHSPIMFMLEKTCRCKSERSPDSPIMFEKVV
ncbi:PHD finger-containing protein 1-like [Tasmannia lanceolata]|uniref:PHD finger-containing protein 1-like n=1 Tax=Tasmannia lanceolata TaxID=3420 RepID=UPI0040643DB2